MAACRRHLLTEPSRETKSPLTEASALAMHLGASLEDEKIFLDYNTRGVFAFMRASETLLHILPLGISHPVTADLLKAAKAGLQDVITSNAAPFKKLDTDRFFSCVRPYYKPHPVGLQEYRGANRYDQPAEPARGAG